MELVWDWDRVSDCCDLLEKVLIVSLWEVRADGESRGRGTGIEWPNFLCSICLCKGGDYIYFCLHIGLCIYIWFTEQDVNLHSRYFCLLFDIFFFFRILVNRQGGCSHNMYL